MSHNDTSVHPTGALGTTYSGLMNPSPHSQSVPSDAYASEGDLTGADSAKKQPINDSVEAAPGIIEGTELAPLGDEKVAADPGLVSQATSLAKSAYNAVVGEK